MKINTIWYFNGKIQRLVEIAAKAVVRHGVTGSSDQIELMQLSPLLHIAPGRDSRVKRYSFIRAQTGSCRDRLAYQPDEAS